MTAPPAPPRTGHGRGSLADMARSLVVLVVIVLAAGSFILFRPKPQAPPHLVSYAGAVRDARAEAHYPVVGPTGLPSGWRATSARTATTAGVVTLHIGFLTPKGAYAALEESGGAADAFLARTDVVGPGARPLAPVTVDGTTWQHYATGRATGQGTASGQALVLQGATSTVVVTGSAGVDELTVLARHLRP
jgi:hypothetical protein